jgi:acyl carrier protein
MTKYYEWLSEEFKKINPDTYLDPNDNYIQKGVIDSLGLIELIENIESHFGIRFEEKHLTDKKFVSIKGLSEIINDIINRGNHEL